MTGDLRHPLALLDDAGLGPWGRERGGSGQVAHAAGAIAPGRLAVAVRHADVGVEARRHED